ncbi:hypothetical protein WIW90_05055 [Sulfolobaceae archaeon RB850M]
MLLDLYNRYILYEVDKKFKAVHDTLNKIDGVEYRLYSPPGDELSAYDGFLWMDCEGCEYEFNIPLLLNHYKQSVIAFHVFNEEQAKKLYKLQERLSECSLVYITPDAKELTLFCESLKDLGP